MKVALLGLVLVALTGSTAPTRVLAFDYTAQRLTYFDPATLVRGGAMAGYQTSLCSWSYSPDRRHVAVSDCQGEMRFFALPSLEPEGRLSWTSRLGRASALAWLSPHRLVAVSTIGTDGSQLVAIDPAARKIVARRDLDGIAVGRAAAGTTAVILTTPSGRFGPPQVLVAGADGTVRTIAVPGLSAGTISTLADEGVPSFESRTPGFAVDPAGRHAYVVGADLTVADIDLGSGEVVAHGPVRSPAKSFEGWTRTARWLGDGLFAVSGYDSHTVAGDVQTTPFGLRIVDARTWTARTLDPASTSFVVGGKTLLAHDGAWSAYDTAGRHLYDVPLDGRNWLSVQGKLGYVCDQRTTVSVIDVSSGAPLAIPKGRPCPTFLTGQVSEN
jgi:hypothetical protein